LSDYLCAVCDNRTTQRRETSVAPSPAQNHQPLENYPTPTTLTLRLRLCDYHDLRQCVTGVLPTTVYEHSLSIHRRTIEGKNGLKCGMKNKQKATYVWIALNPQNQKCSTTKNGATLTHCFCPPRRLYDPRGTVLALPYFTSSLRPSLRSWRTPPPAGRSW
jgi:hypothetical protein